MGRHVVLLLLACCVCDAFANQADENHDRRIAYLDSGVYAGVGLPFLVTLGALVTPRWRDLDYAPIGQLELHTSFIVTQIDMLMGVQHVDQGIYRSALLGYSAVVGLGEGGGARDGFIVRYLQTTPLHDNVYVTRFWAVDFTYQPETRGANRKSASVFPAIHFGWTFAPF